MKMTLVPQGKPWTLLRILHLMQTSCNILLVILLQLQLSFKSNPSTGDCFTSPKIHGAVMGWTLAKLPRHSRAPSLVLRGHGLDRQQDQHEHEHQHEHDQWIDSTTTFKNNKHNKNNNHNNHNNHKLDLKIILIDHYDSYTFNLYDMIASLCKDPPILLSKDSLPAPTDTFLNPHYNSTSTLAFPPCDAIILSPGPGRPSCPDDMGYTLEWIRHASHHGIPILGVCLGHQALGHYHGATVREAFTPVHGQVHTIQLVQQQQQQEQEQQHPPSITTPNCILWEGIQNQHGFEMEAQTNHTVETPVTRYHSLKVDHLGPNHPLQVTAWYHDAATNESVIMALQHKTLPQFGVQFHPESIGTPAGKQIMSNFLQFAHNSATQKRVEGQQMKDETGNMSKQNNNPRQDKSWIPPPFVPRPNKPSSLSSESSLVHSSSTPSTPSTSTTTTTTSRGSTSSPQRSIHASVRMVTGIQASTEQVFQRLYGKSSVTATGSAGTTGTSGAAPPPPPAVWLDSSLQQPPFFMAQEKKDNAFNNHDIDHDKMMLSRYSIMAGMTGPLSQRIDYYGQEHSVEKQGVYVTNINGTMHKDESVEDVLDYLQQQQLGSIEIQTTVENHVEDGDSNRTSLDLPFLGGFLGYLGYEVRHDTQRKLDDQQFGNHPQNPTLHSSHQPLPSQGPTTPNNNTMSAPPSPVLKPGDEVLTNPHVPTAAFLFCDQCLLYDHIKNIWYLVEVTMSDSPTSKSSWMSTTEEILRSLITEPEMLRPPKSEGIHSSTTSIKSKSRKDPPTTSSPLIPNRSRSTYRENVAQCHEFIRLGESYELCLTNQLEMTVPRKIIADSDHQQLVEEELDPFQLYQILRHRNPAPFAAYVNFQSPTTNDKQGTGNVNAGSQVTICCSSPERFLSVRPSKTKHYVEWIAEAKPIKGTAARRMRKDNQYDTLEDAAVALELQNSIKNRAENLMIVDLLRNDLHRVCQTGTVHVPKLMAIESYATVHQMVSTIRGTLARFSTLEEHEKDQDDSILNPNTRTNTALDALIACFPGGSMTGAPKRRTMELLHELEEGVSRGPYAGCLGYLSLDGRMDMNIIIRSIVLTPSTTATTTLNGVDASTANVNNVKEKGKDCGGRWKISVGAGGAITALSESEDEYDEMLLKARAIKESMEDWIRRNNGNTAEQGVDMKNGYHSNKNGFEVPLVATAELHKERK